MLYAGSGRHRPARRPVTTAPRPYADAPRLPDVPELDPRVLVGASGPVELEIGPGRGGFIYERVAVDAAVRIIGLEIRRKWATLVDRRLAALGHGPRARVFAEDARDVLPRFVAGTISAVFVHFPDPWWKKRHQKRLVLAGRLLDELSRVVVPGGAILVQTDVEERADAYQALFDAHPAFEPFPGGPRVAENPYGAKSPRERRAEADGLPIVRLHYRRVPPG
jgi:tRNA (guanine-N7-)-methyltransferase